MDPCRLSAIITAVANHLYATLSKEEFECVNILVSELSKAMFSMTLLRDICDEERFNKEK